MNGSSRKSSSGSCMNADASMSFCLMPFDMSLQIVPFLLSRSKNPSHFSMRSSTLSRFLTFETK